MLALMETIVAELLKTIHAGKEGGGEGEDNINAKSWLSTDSNLPAISESLIIEIRSDLTPDLRSFWSRLADPRLYDGKTVSWTS